MWSSCRSRTSSRAWLLSVLTILSIAVLPVSSQATAQVLQVTVMQFSDSASLEQCRMDLLEVDENMNLRLEREEYAAFLQLQTANQLSSDFQDLPIRLESVYFSAACWCDVVSPGDDQCCIGGKDHVPLDASTSSPLVDPYLNFFCQQVQLGLESQGYDVGPPDPALVETVEPTEVQVTPTASPTMTVTEATTDAPTVSPSEQPTTTSPTVAVTEAITMIETTTEAPTVSPTIAMTTVEPTDEPTPVSQAGGTVEIEITTDVPTTSPVALGGSAEIPTVNFGGSAAISMEPSMTPTTSMAPTDAPLGGSAVVSMEPSSLPTISPTASPTASPTPVPTKEPSGSPTMAPTLPTLCVDFQYVVRNQVGLDAEAIFNEENNSVLQGLKRATENITIDILNGDYPPSARKRHLREQTPASSRQQHERDNALRPIPNILNLPTTTTKKQAKAYASTVDAERQDDNPQRRLLQSKMNRLRGRQHHHQHKRHLAYYTADYPVIINSVTDNPLCNGSAQNQRIMCAIVSSTVCVVLEPGDDPDVIRDVLITGLRIAVDSGDFLGRIPAEDLVMNTNNQNQDTNEESQFP